MESGNARLRIAVLAGGDSSERAVSLESGRCVERALNQAGHTATRFDPALTPLASIDWTAFAACFIALHGGAGEDGRIQQQLQDLGVRYTGSGPTASRLAMSKSATKERLVQADLPTPPYVLLSGSETASEALDRTKSVRFPLIVKPDSQGSSLGVSCVRTEDELRHSLEQAFGFDPYAIAEPWIEGREFTVAVIGRRALPLLEICSQGIFSYDQKYHTAATHDVDPPSAPRGLRELAERTAEALGTAGLVRVDLMVDRQQRPWILEINTVPGMTDHSLAPLAAARAGLDMPALCDLLVRQSLEVEVLT